jgi:hypothetical protein
MQNVFFLQEIILYESLWSRNNEQTDSLALNLEAEFLSYTNLQM